jgi:multimeric flavodoxin WrbA
VYEIRNSTTATAADVKFIMDISFKVQLIAELAFHYLAFAPDFGATGCFYATYNMKSATNNLTVSDTTTTCYAKVALSDVHCAAMPVYDCNMTSV